MSITLKVINIISPKSANNTAKSMPAPTVIKNSPNSNPLKGPILASNSCLNSLFANTTPAKNVPKAGEIPTKLINAAIPITSINAAAVDISRAPDSATILKSGRLR